MKRFLKLSALVLAIALVGAFVLNLSKPLKRLTQKKVVNPDNVLQSDSIIWRGDHTLHGLTYHMNEDGSWHIFGTTTQSTGLYLTFERFSLEAGKTYILSSGMKHASGLNYYLCLEGTDGYKYLGDLEPEYYPSSTRIYGAFEAQEGVTYHVDFIVPYAGAVIDEVIYPCLVEGTEPGDFYIYK